MAKKALGRGLGAIFGTESVASADAEKKIQQDKEPSEKKSPDMRSSEKKTSEKKVPEKKAPAKKSQETERQMVRLSLVEPNRSQPRKHFDEESLKELADSIKRFGVLQPLIVRRTGITYTIIAGERRWRAAKLAGLREVPVIVTELEKEDAAEIALIENIQREDLGAVEEAMAYKELMDAYGLTQEQVAEKVSKSRTAVTNSLRLLQLPEEVLSMLSEGALSAGHARCLITIEDRKALIELAEEIVRKGLSVRDAEKRAKALKEGSRSGAQRKKQEKTGEDELSELFLQDLEKQLCEGLGTKVRIRSGAGEKGRIEIEYYSMDDLNRISDLLR